MLEYLKNIDEALFLYLNGMHNNFFDFLMHWITMQETWYPFYLLLASWIIWKYKRKGIPVILILIISIVISDQFTSAFMKPFFERLRPCHDPQIGTLVHVVDACGGLYGFASSHASNSFALATLLYLFFRSNYRYTSIFFIWATLVSYSRIYVGVHYPGDIITGAMIGILIAWILYYLYVRLPSKYKLTE